jgi:hypothetical protein
MIEFMIGVTAVVGFGVFILLLCFIGLWAINGCADLIRELVFRGR